MITILKSVNIDTYLNGYNIDHINCIDLQLAGAAGHYDYDNYYYYCFYYTLFRNWTKASPENFEVFRNAIYQKFGLAIKSNTVTNAAELLALIKSKLDQAIPIILPVKYNQLFYHTTYLNQENNFNHALLISDYYTEKPVIVIREFVHVRPVIMALTRGDVFAKLHLKEEHLTEIWTNSNSGFLKDGSNFYNTVYTIEKSGDPQIKSYRDLLADFLNNYDIRIFNQLAQQVEEFNQKLETIEHQRYRRFLTRSFNAPVTIIFEVLRKALNLAENQTTAAKWEQFQRKYLEFRAVLINKLGFYALRKKLFTAAEKEELFKQISTLDREFFNLVSEIADTARKDAGDLSGCKNGMVNYATGALIKADSQLNSPSIALNDENDFWVSLASSSTHWLQVDLGQPREISKFVIKHHGDIQLNTIDFIIQGGNGGDEWNNLFQIKGNTSGETECQIKPVTYRYFRLFITRPALTDSYARIRKFEIWGFEK